jgi:hypothetical protein
MNILKPIALKNNLLKTMSFILMVAALMITSCSKDKRAERRLEKVKNWQIEQIFYQKAEAGFGGIGAKVATEYNCGTMVFNKDGSGSYDYMLDKQHRTGTFTWTLTAGNLSFNYAAASTMGAQAVTYNIIQQSSTSLVMQGDEALVDGSGTFALNATFHLKK